MEEILEYTIKQIAFLKSVQYKRNQAHALIVEGEISALEDIKKMIESKIKL